MLKLPKRRRVKRPTLLATRSQLAKNTRFNKKSYKPLYDQLKANNHALAKALSKEKQESQYLFTRNIELTSEVQELGVACNQRDDIISGVLKNAKETFQLLLNISTYVTNTIASCQQAIGTARFTPKKSNANNRRDSTRRLSGKSPARGVVQPMVSGHTITKPTINLSRVNIQREYRVQNPPNLSDIDEGLTPDRSPSTAESTRPVRISIARSLNYSPRRVDALPERLQGSSRPSGGSNRRSSGGSKRKSSRHSVRRSLVTSERLSDVSLPRQSSTAELQIGESRRSPRVALHDVSRLLQNSQSVNIRTLLETSSDMEITQSHQTPCNTSVETPNNVVAAPNIDETIETTIEPAEVSKTNENVIETSFVPEKSDSTKKKSQISSPSDEDDPLEGPSWLLNDNESSEFFNDPEITTTTNNDVSSNSIAKEITRIDRSSSDDDDDPTNNSKNKRKSKTPETPHDTYVSVRARNRRLSSDEDFDETVKTIPEWATPPTQSFYRRLNNDDERTEALNLPFCIARKRGSVRDDDDDDYTLLWKRKGATKNCNFGLDDLILPVLESPIVRKVVIPPLEPEPTTNIQRLNETFGNFPVPCPPAIGEETIFDHSELVLPIIAMTSDSTRSSAIVRHVERSDEDEIATKKRKKNYKKISSSDDSDYSPTVKKKTTKMRRKPVKKVAKDPSAAKVVLKKLNDRAVKKGTSSPESRRSEEPENLCSNDDTHNSLNSAQPDGSSDSDVSNASANNHVASGRPRRQKAPKNLQEPSLGRKLRRN